MIGRRLDVPRPPRPLRLAILVVMCLSAGWAVVSPLGSIPDEPVHVIYAASVVRGDLGSGPFGRAVRVPAWTAKVASTTCPAVRPFITADCIQSLGGARTEVTTETGAGRYPPLYYALVGWPTLVGFGSGDSIWLIMRLLSVLLAGLLLWVGGCAWDRDSGVLAGALLVSCTPMTTFLVGSVNPNGVEIAAGMAFVLAASGLLKQWRTARGPTSWSAPFAVATTGSFLALVRPGSHLLLLALLGVVVVLGASETRTAIGARAVSAIAPAVALGGAVVLAAVYARVSAPAASTPVLHPIGLRQALAITAHGAPRYVGEFVGLFGWRDHAPPVTVRLLWIALAAALVVAALLVGRLWERLSLSLLLVGSLFLAPLFVFLTLFRDGLGYQARYAMALTQSLPVLAAVILIRRAQVPRSGQVALALLPVVTLVLQLLVLTGSWLRYAVGLPLTEGPIRALGQIRWVPPAWRLGLVLLALAAVATGRLVQAQLASMKPSPASASTATRLGWKSSNVEGRRNDE